MEWLNTAQSKIEQKQLSFIWGLACHKSLEYLARAETKLLVHDKILTPVGWICCWSNCALDPLYT